MLPWQLFFVRRVFVSISKLMQTSFVFVAMAFSMTFFYSCQRSKHKSRAKIHENETTRREYSCHFDQFETSYLYFVTQLPKWTHFGNCFNVKVLNIELRFQSWHFKCINRNWWTPFFCSKNVTGIWIRILDQKENWKENELKIITSTVAFSIFSILRI